jgi:hypothetical protein
VFRASLLLDCRSFSLAVASPIPLLPRRAFRWVSETRPLPYFFLSSLLPQPPLTLTYSLFSFLPFPPHRPLHGCDVRLPAVPLPTRFSRFHPLGARVLAFFFRVPSSGLTFVLPPCQTPLTVLQRLRICLTTIISSGRLPASPPGNSRPRRLALVC